MPEISEVARVVHFLRTHLVGRTIASVTAKDDDKIFGAVGTSAAAYQTQLPGKKIVGVGQQGKYFWIEMDSAPHPLMHLGMTGWMHIRDVHTYYYAGKKDKTEWPPKFTKWQFKTDGDKPVEVAFADSRRFARCRLIECDAKNIRNVSPLKENGPDPVIDKDKVTVEWLADKCAKRNVPIKAWLLDQANISGIGNWVGDDILYNAKIHPETYCKDLSQGQIQRLHDSIHYICGTACELLGESEKFPDTWLFHYRWGKKGPKHMPITWLTVGGRTTAVITSVQKKTDGESKAEKTKKVKREEEAEPDEMDDEPVKSAKNSKKLADEKPSAKRRKVEPKVEPDTPNTKSKTPSSTKAKLVKQEEPAPGRRRSQRVSKA